MWTRAGVRVALVHAGSGYGLIWGHNPATRSGRSQTRSGITTLGKLTPYFST